MRPAHDRPGGLSAGPRHGRRPRSPGTWRTPRGPAPWPRPAWRVATSRSPTAASSHAARLGAHERRGVLASNATLPGLNSSQGTYFRDRRNGHRNGDPVSTGVAKGRLGHGRHQQPADLVATHLRQRHPQVQVMVKKTSLRRAQAPFKLPRHDGRHLLSETFIRGERQRIQDEGTAAPAPRLYGITTETTSRETKRAELAQRAVSEEQSDRARKQLSSGSADGDNVIAPDATLTQVDHGQSSGCTSGTRRVHLSPSPSGSAQRHRLRTCSTTTRASRAGARRQAQRNSCTSRGKADPRQPSPR